jgi:hypothetical protein
MNHNHHIQPIIEAIMSTLKLKLFLFYVLHFVTMILKQTLLDLLYCHLYVDLIIFKKQEGESNLVDPMEMFQAFAILF